MFNEEQEQEHLHYIFEIEKRFNGVSVNDLRRLAFQLARAEQHIESF